METTFKEKTGNIRCISHGSPSKIQASFRSLSNHQEDSRKEPFLCPPEQILYPGTTSLLLQYLCALVSLPSQQELLLSDWFFFSSLYSSSTLHMRTVYSTLSHEFFLPCLPSQNIVFGTDIYRDIQIDILLSQLRNTHCSVTAP